MAEFKWQATVRQKKEADEDPFTCSKGTVWVEPPQPHTQNVYCLQGQTRPLHVPLASQKGNRCAGDNTNHNSEKAE